MNKYINTPVPLGPLPRKTGSAGEIGRGFQYLRFASRWWDAGLRYPLVRGPCRGLLKRALQELKSSEVDSPLLEAGSQRGVSPFGAGFRAAVSLGWLRRQCWYGAVSPRGAPLRACGPASSYALSYAPAFRFHRPPGLPSWASA